MIILISEFYLIRALIRVVEIRVEITVQIRVEINVQIRAEISAQIRVEISAQIRIEISNSEVPYKNTQKLLISPQKGSISTSYFIPQTTYMWFGTFL